MCLLVPVQLAMNSSLMVAKILGISCLNLSLMVPSCSAHLLNISNKLLGNFQCHKMMMQVSTAP